TLDFARQVIEEETGAPLEIQSRAAEIPESAAAGETRLIARDDKKNPLISTFEWTADAAQRILRVPAGFMRNQTQERIEQLAGDVECQWRGTAPAGSGRFHAEPDAGADRAARAGTRGVHDRPGARRGRHRDREEDDGGNDRELSEKSVIASGEAQSHRRG